MDDLIGRVGRARLLAVPKGRIRNPEVGGGGKGDGGALEPDRRNAE